MKKFLSVLLCLLLVLSLAACAAEPADNTDTTTTAATTTTTEADTTPTDPVDDPVDEPADEVPTDIGDEGYLVISSFDAAAKTAKVLGANKAVQEITYTGDEPQVGIAYKFVKSDDVYELTLPTYFRPLDEPARDFRTFDNGGDSADALGWYNTDTQSIWQITLNEDTVVFMRYSATEWRVLTGADAIKYSDYPLMAWVGIDGEVNGPFVAEDETASIILVGQKKEATGEIIRIGEGDTFYFDEEGYGWSEGDIIIE